MKFFMILFMGLATVSCGTKQYSTYDDLFDLAPAQGDGVIVKNYALDRFYALRNRLISSQVLRPHLYRVRSPRNGGIRSGVIAVIDLLGEKKRAGMAWLMETNVSQDNRLCFIAIWLDLQDGRLVEDELRRVYAQVEVFEPRVAVPRGTDQYELLLPGQPVQPGFDLVGVVQTGRH